MDACHCQNIEFLLLVSSSILGIYLDSLSFSTGVPNINQATDDCTIDYNYTIFWGVISYSSIEEIGVFQL